MTRDRQSDQARDPSHTIYELQRTLWAFEGLSEVMDPSTQLDRQPRANVATLISILTERFEHLLDEVELRWQSTPTPVSAPTQEGDHHGMP
jgi:hypothetical protein